MNDKLIGYLGALIASIFFGSNYVPCKPFDMGDGLVFQFLMGCGILTVGFITQAFVVLPFVWDWGILLGGMAWALGNLFVIPAIRFAGLGPAFLTWSLGNLIFGYIWGRIGAFGLSRESPIYESFSLLGILLAVLSLIIFAFIRPSIDEPKSIRRKMVEGSAVNGDLEDQETASGDVMASYPLSVYEDELAIAKPKGDSPIAEYYEKGMSALRGCSYSVFDQLGLLLDKAPYMRRPLGMAMAIFAGLCYSTTLVPFKVWQERQVEHHVKIGGLDAQFCYFSGIWMTTLAFFLVYNLLTWPPRVNPKAMVPSFLSGVGWAIAACGWCISTEYNGFTTGYPIVNVGPILVASLWSLIVFREYKGVRNLILLFLSLSLLVVSITCLVLSNTKLD